MAPQVKCRSGEAAAQLHWRKHHELSKGKTTAQSSCLIWGRKFYSDSRRKGSSLHPVLSFKRRTIPPLLAMNSTLVPWIYNLLYSPHKHLMSSTCLDMEDLSTAGSRNFSPDINNCNRIIWFLMGSAFPIIILPSSCQHSLNGYYYPTDSILTPIIWEAH